MHEPNLSCDCPDCERRNRRLDALVAGGVILVMLIGTYHLWQQIVMALTGGL